MTRISRSPRLVALLAACALGALAAPAAADDPISAAHRVADDGAAYATDVTERVAAGCRPFVLDWTPEPLEMKPFIMNDSTYYRITGGGTAHLSCSTAVRIQARLADISAPVYRQAFGGMSPRYLTSRDPMDTGYVDVAYFGPDAPVVRPFGQATVHVEVYRKLANGRYSTISNGCMEWRYVVQPAASLTVSDPTAKGACAYGAAFLAADTVDAAGVDVVQESDPEAER